MKNSDIGAVAASEKVERLRRQGDFRHHNNDVFAFFKHLVNEPDIYHRFTASRNSVKQSCQNLALGILTEQAFKCRLLFLVEDNFLFFNSNGLILARITVDLIIKNFNKTFFLKSLNDRRSKPREIADLFNGCCTDIGKGVQHLKLFFCKLLRRS